MSCKQSVKLTLGGYIKFNFLRNGIKAQIVGLLISLSLFVVGFAVWNFLAYPFSLQDVDLKMTSYQKYVLLEQNGILAYVAETEYDNFLYILTPSMILNRYNLQMRCELPAGVVTAIPGRFRYFVLEIEGYSVELTARGNSRFQLHHILAFVAYIISSINVSYYIHQRYLRKVAK